MSSSCRHLPAQSSTMMQNTNALQVHYVSQAHMRQSAGSLAAGCDRQRLLPLVHVPSTETCYAPHISLHVHEGSAGAYCTAAGRWAACSMS
jgi:hypothetical protein